MLLGDFPACVVSEYVVSRNDLLHLLSPEILGTAKCLLINSYIIFLSFLEWPLFASKTPAGTVIEIS